MARFLIWVVFFPQGSGSVSGFYVYFLWQDLIHTAHQITTHTLKMTPAFPLHGCLDEELDYISSALQKICICVCVGLRSNGISIIPHQCPWVPQEALLTLLGNISPPCLLWQRGIGFSPWTEVGGRKMIRYFAGEKLFVTYLHLCLAFTWSVQDSPRHSKTCKLNPTAISFHIVNKRYLWFPVLIKQNVIFKTRYILNGGNINNENIGICGKFHNPFRKCLWPRSWVQLYFSWEKNISKKTPVWNKTH